MASDGIEAEELGRVLSMYGARRAEASRAAAAFGRRAADRGGCRSVVLE
jgi:hypothetical protein